MSQRARTTTIIVASALALAGGFGLGWLRHRPAPGPTAALGTTSAAPASRTEAATPPTPASRPARGDFVGSATCTPCHAAQAKAYAGSHHARALLRSTTENVPAKVADLSFATALGGSTRFAGKDGHVTVTSPNANAHAQTFDIAYLAGVFPLQQFVVPTERGKLQTLGVSWDTRSAKDGGERLFHLYGPRGVAPADELFFTRSAQNWNHVCADCHSTFVERRYDLASDAFDTRWVELSVGCEACHGPGAAHVRAATSGVKSPAYSFTVTLKPAAPWAPSPSGSPTPRAVDESELEACAPCHSRRQPLHEGFLAGDPLLDAFEPELLTPGRYHADGQVDGEVYEWGSFLQSKMHASGVRCSDCHEPHAAELRAPGNALCTRCHASARFDQASHSHHEGAKAPACVDCHMPKKVFMQVDERRDHSIRIPRPDWSVEFATPNACNACHTKETPRWAAEAVAKWYPSSAQRPHFGRALALDRQGSVEAPPALDALARDAKAPSIARATALERLGHFPSRRALETLRTALASDEPLVVYGAVLGASALPIAQRAELLMAAVAHPRRAIRVAVGRALATLPLEQTNADTRRAVERAFADVEETFAISASRPETHVEKSSFELGRGHAGEAETELETALRLAPCLAAAHLNRADLARARSDEALAERELRAAIGCAPQNAFAQHALGLWFVRNGKRREALASLKKAVELDPGEARFGYVLAVATADGGDLAGAVELLQAALRQQPNDRDLLQALAGYLRRLDRKEAASEAERRLQALVHD
jgi:predicted CXXCH cytochrome family protein